SALGPDHWQTDDARRAIAKLEAIAKMPAEGRKAIGSVGALDARGTALESQARFGEAEALANAVYQIHEKWLGAEHVDTVACLGNLAFHRQRAGKFEAAEAIGRRVLSLQERHLGPEHPRTAKTRNNLGVALREQGKLEEAEPLIRAALATAEQTLGL